MTAKTSRIVGEEPHLGAWSAALFTTLGLCAAALVACLSVAITNAGPLFNDTAAAYFARGHKDGYGWVVLLANNTIGLNALIVTQFLIVALAVWLPARVISREFPVGVSHMRALAIVLLSGCLGALPFVVPFLGAEIFAPTLVLAIAAIAVFAREMTMADRLAATGLGIVSVFMAPELHVITILSVPVAALVSVLVALRRWWLAPVLVMVIAAAGFLERGAGTTPTAPAIPYGTMQIIADGPGLRYLAETCGGSDTATCHLFEALNKGRDTRRMSFEAMAFGTSARNGSFRLLPVETKHAIAADQSRFVLRVFLAHPGHTIRYAIGNMLSQANHYSVTDAVPSASSRARIRSTNGTLPADLQELRLNADEPWLDTLAAFHTLVYAISALLIVVLVVLPQTAPPLRLRAFVLMLLSGVMLNALVVGMLGVPNGLAGARMALLLPVGLAFLLIFFSPDKIGGHK